MNKIYKKRLLLCILGLSIYSISGLATASTGGVYTHGDGDYDFWWSIEDNTQRSLAISVKVQGIDSNYKYGPSTYMNVDFYGQGDLSPKVRGPDSDFSQTDWLITVYYDGNTYTTPAWYTCTVSPGDRSDSYNSPVVVKVNETPDNPHQLFTATVTTPDSGSCPDVPLVLLPNSSSEEQIEALSGSRLPMYDPAKTIQAFKKDKNYKKKGIKVKEMLKKAEAMLAKARALEADATKKAANK